MDLNINTDKVKVAYDAKKNYEFLSEPGNYESLMPDSVEKFKLNENGGFVFQLKGMPAISLKLDEKSPYDKIVWGSASDKFDFKLWAEINPVSDTESEVQFLFYGDLNPMITMMAKKPLGRFMETLSANYAKVNF